MFIKVLLFKDLICIYSFMLPSGKMDERCDSKLILAATELCSLSAVYFLK